jgi:hypothetical protein
MIPAADSCNCKDWPSGYRELKDVIFTAMIHGTVYAGPDLRFCPFCGKNFKEGE